MKEQIVAAEPRPVTDEQLDETFALTQEIADGCAEEYGDALGTFNTVDTARDMDQLREALGDEQLTYLGYSYGTTLGSTYAELFPDKVRALVLDAAVDPDGDPRTNAEQSAASLEAGFDAFARELRRADRRLPDRSRPARLRRGPARAGGEDPDPQQRARPGRRDAPGHAGRRAHGDPGRPVRHRVLAAAGPGPRRRPAGRLGRAVLPRRQLRRPARGRHATRTCWTPTSRSTAPTPTRTRRWTRRRCARSPPSGTRSTRSSGPGPRPGSTPARSGRPSARPLPERDAEGSTPILVVGNSGDPVTPLAGAGRHGRAARQPATCSSGRGQGHTAYPKTDCVNANVNAYLIGLTPPVDGLTCPA